MLRLPYLHVPTKPAHWGETALLCHHILKRVIVQCVNGGARNGVAVSRDPVEQRFQPTYNNLVM